MGTVRGEEKTLRDRGLHGIGRYSRHLDLSGIEMIELGGLFYVNAAEATVSVRENEKAIAVLPCV